MNQKCFRLEMLIAIVHQSWFSDHYHAVPQYHDVDNGDGGKVCDEDLATRAA